jgi:hypothetical protein
LKSLVKARWASSDFHKKICSLKSYQSSVIPGRILGATSVDQLKDIAAVDIALSAEELKRLDTVSGLPAEYPGCMIEHRDAERRPRSFKALDRTSLIGSLN